MCISCKLSLRAHAPNANAPNDSTHAAERVFLLAVHPRIRRMHLTYRYIKHCTTV